jgi:hypothetical protein
VRRALVQGVPVTREGHIVGRSGSRAPRSTEETVMAHFKCLRCRSRVWRDDHADDLCPGCGDPLETVAELSELIGLRSLGSGRDRARRTPPNRSARISKQIRDTIARHDAERQRRIDAERS